jgi:hypothetical protein
MGQAKNRGTYKQRKESKMKEQLKDMDKMFSNKTTQYGMDIFFDNISKEDLSNIAEITNEISVGDIKVNGNWKVNGNQISIFYPEMKTSLEDQLLKLDRNRVIFELICEVYNKKCNTSISYNGSEFYINNANMKEVA